MQTLEDQILVEATKAVQGINQLKSGITGLKTQLDSLSKNNGLSNFNKQAKQGTSVLNALQKTFNFSAIYLGARQVLNTLTDMTNASVDYTETVNLFSVSFGKGLEGLNEYYEQALDFQERLEEKLGVNIEESMRYQALFNSMTKSMGLGANYAYTLSENMTKLGYDLASLYNIDPDSAMTKLRAGLAGQTEPLRELGLDITEQSLKPVAESLGVTESIRNMSQAEKAVLRYIAVLRQAQIAQGDFARTMDSPANQLRIFNAQVTAFKRNMGNLWQGILGGVLPYVNAVMMVINELLKMVAKLFGFEVSSQPVNVSANIGADDLSDDLGTASDNAKKLKNQLMGFDEINNITLDNDTSSGNGTSGTEIGGIDQRLLDALTGYDNLMDSVSNKATDIRDKMLEWLGFERDDEGTWRLKEGLTNFEKILDVAKLIGWAIGTWKVSSTITNLLKNLGILKGKQNFQIAFGLTLALTGIMAQWQGTSHLLDGDVDLFTILETLLGTAGGAFGIVSILKATKLGKSLSLGNKLKVGFGVMLGIQGVQVFLDGINEGDIKKTLLGAFEGVTSISLALNGLFGGKLLQGIKNTISGISNFSSAINISTGAIGKHATATNSAGKSMTSFAKTGATVVAGLAGITAGSALSYSSMKDFATGEIESAEAGIKLAGSLGLATSAGVLAGSQFGTTGMIIGGLAGLISSATTAYMGYKDGIESLSIPTTTLTEEIKSLTKELDNNRRAHEDAVKSIKDTYENQLVEAEYADKLSQQLLGLVDVNGKVKDGNEERVKLILGELNNALGTEYDLNDNLITKNGEVITSYKELQNGIRETIDAKAEEAKQTANLELYKEAVKEEIKLERDKLKAKEELAKAEQEYNDLMAEGLSEWTLTHDENCKAIITNYTEVANAYANTIEKCGEAREETSYYLNEVTADMVETTGIISEEMLRQGQNYSETLQDMLATNTSKWEENYNNLSSATQSAMLAQSTTLDNWSPILQQKWLEMAQNSSEKFLIAINQVDTGTQSKILSTITVTEGLTPSMIEAWRNLGQNSKDDFNDALFSLPTDIQILIQTMTNTTEALTAEQVQKWADLARNNKSAYENNLIGLDEITRQRVQSCVDAVNNKQWTAEEASRGLADAVERGVNTIDTTEAGRQAVNGVAEGINRNKSNWSLSSAVSGLANSVSSMLKNKLGIHSPSTVMRDLVGRFIPLGVAAGIDMEANSVYSSIENLNKGIKVRTSDFLIDTTQFVDYGAISGNINTQAKVEINNLPQQVKQAIIEGMSQVSIPVEIEAKADEGIIFTKVQAKAREFVIQTGEEPFPSPA